MPTVVAEAMMHAVPCIVSDAIGTTAYICDGVNGFIFKSEDVTALAEKIEWCVTNREKLGETGRKARSIYDKYFSITAFETKFMKIVKDALGNQ